MRILHYIDRIAAGELLSDHLLHIVGVESTFADSKLISRKDNFRKALKELRPDIVNIHTCWQRASSSRARLARKQGAAVVVSPHWQLSKLSRTKEQRVSKFFKTIFYQRRMITDADALLVSSAHERGELIRLGWNKHIEVVPAPVFHREMADDETAAQLTAFYRKIADTRYRLAMTRNEFRAVSSLLHAGVVSDVSELAPDENRQEILHGLTPDEWKRILLLAADEEVTDVISLGISRLQQGVPPLTASEVNRYPLRHSKQKGPLDDDNLLVGNPFLKERLEDITLDNETSLHRIATMLINAKRLVRKGRFSLRHLCDLYWVLRYQDYDEVRLEKILRKMSVLRFARRIIGILSSEFLLAEGFMPLSPLNDRKANRMRALLFGREPLKH